MEGKTCTKCGELKLYKEFYRDKTKKDGYKNPCKICLNPNYSGPKKQILRTDKGKTCFNCNVHKPFEEFPKAKKYKDGHENTCKACFKLNEASEKTCITCGETKSVDNFFRQSHNNDGFKINCKKCLAIIQEKTKSEDIDKKCGKCDKSKTLTEFNKNKYVKGGYENYCKQCKSKNSKKNYNKDIELNRLKRKNARRIYNKSEQGKENNYKSNVKRRSFKHKVFFKPFERKWILERDKYTCQSCGIKVHDRSTGNWNTPDKANIDHIIAISDGGNSEPANLWTLCRTCNLKKGNKRLENLQEQLTLFEG